MENSKSKREQRRQRKYKRLTDAGFSSKEATRYKDHSDKKITALIARRNKYLDDIVNIRSGGGNNG